MTDPSELPEWLHTDLESEIHRFMGHDGQSDEANDWVTDLLSALSPHVARALAGERLGYTSADLNRAYHEGRAAVEATEEPGGISDLAAMLDAERKAQGLDRRDLAGRLGIHPAGITRSLNYTLTLPMAEKIAAALGCRIEARLVRATVPSAKGGPG